MNLFSKLTHLLIGLACLLAALALLSHAGLPKRADYTGFAKANKVYVAPEIGFAAPPFTLITPALDSFALEQVQGSMTIINFWATWCMPCRMELQELQNLYRSYPSQIRILGVNLGESADAVARWTSELGLTFDILLDPMESVAQLYQIRGQPSTYLLDAKHRIQNIYFGPIRFEQLSQDIHLITHS